jgi:hypothetical protein
VVGNRGTPTNHPNRDNFFAPISALSNNALKQSARAAGLFTETGVYFPHSSRPLLSFSFERICSHVRPSPSWQLAFRQAENRS